MISQRAIYARIFTRIVRILGPQLIEPLVLDGLAGGVTLVGVHRQKLCHQLNLCIIHHRGVSSFQGFWMRNLRKLEALKSDVALEFFLEKVGQGSKHFLNDEQLVDFGVSWEERLSIHELSQNTSYSPNINLLAVW